MSTKKVRVSSRGCDLWNTIARVVHCAGVLQILIFIETLEDWNYCTK